MSSQRHPRAAALFMVLAVLFAVNCNTWTRIPPSSAPGASVEQAPLESPPEIVPVVEGQAVAQVQAEPPLPVVTLAAEPQPAPLQLEDDTAHPAGEPAGCLSGSAQEALSGPPEMLAYADTLVDVNTSFAARLLPNTWNGLTGLFTWQEYGILSLDVSDVQNAFVIQRMLNALHVAGFVTWLRDTTDQGLHILAIPLTDPAVMGSNWAPYIESYWQDRSARPSGDPAVLPVLKLPPCTWMVERGYAPPVSMAWWSTDLHSWPDYALAASFYQALTTAAAEVVAERIDWLGAQFPEGPDTMCGPLVWSIMRDAGVFPPGWGDWLSGPKSFWLAQPEKNGRPWSLFPRESYEIHHFSQPLGSFDFNLFPLYPGDFIYTFAAKDGFEHMLLVTEVTADGSVYTVSNLVKVEPVPQTTIERVLLLNYHDRRQGIARNQWATDKINGRTGHAGFQVFRWAWMAKDIAGEPVPDTVLPGDTLGLLAARWKTPAAAIAEYNGIALDAPLAVGQVVLIPPNER